jgi:hypothetical protein
MTWTAAFAVAGLGIFHGLNPAMGWLFAVALAHQRRTRTPHPPRPAAVATGPGGTAAGSAAVAAGAAPGPVGSAAVAVLAAGSAAAGPAAVGGSAADGRPAARTGPAGQLAGGRSGGASAGGAGVGWGGRAAVLRALPPIAAGHLASVAAVAVAFAVTESVVASRAAAIGGGALLVGLGLWRLLSTRHFRWVGMRLSAWELATWSFLMSSVHGAGLMLIPVLAHHSPLPATASITTALAAAALHTATMLVTAGAIALLVTELLGLAVLRHAWLNVDRIWALTLLAAGLTTLLRT